MSLQRATRAPGNTVVHTFSVFPRPPHSTRRAKTILMRQRHRGSHFSLPSFRLRLFFYACVCGCVGCHPPPHHGCHPPSPSHILDPYCHPSILSFSLIFSFFRRRDKAFLFSLVHTPSHQHPSLGRLSLCCRQSFSHTLLPLSTPLPPPPNSCQSPPPPNPSLLRALLGVSSQPMVNTRKNRGSHTSPLCWMLQSQHRMQALVFLASSVRVRVGAPHRVPSFPL